jgi:hypothetical protein
MKIQPSRKNERYLAPRYISISVLHIHGNHLERQKIVRFGRWGGVFLEIKEGLNFHANIAFC